MERLFKLDWILVFENIFHLINSHFVVFSPQVLPPVCPICENLSIVNNRLCPIQKNNCYHKSVPQAWQYSSSQYQNKTYSSL